MQYLITSSINSPYLTKWFNPENHFVKGVNMVVYDLVNQLFFDDSNSWQDIEIDNL